VTRGRGFQGVECAALLRESGYCEGDVRVELCRRLGNLLPLTWCGGWPDRAYAATGESRSGSQGHARQDGAASQFGREWRAGHALTLARRFRAPTAHEPPDERPPEQPIEESSQNSESEELKGLSGWASLGCRAGSMSMVMATSSSPPKFGARVACRAGTVG